jgi:hypothetical protein
MALLPGDIFNLYPAIREKNRERVVAEAVSYAIMTAESCWMAFSEKQK